MRCLIAAVLVVAAGCSGDAEDRGSRGGGAATIVSSVEIPSPGASRAWAVEYTSQTIDGEPTTVTGWVAVPEGKAPEEGWPMLAYGHPTSGLDDGCRPSVRGRSNPLQFAAALDRGWAVSASDFEGLGGPGLHPYLVGESEARSVLDLVEAAGDLDGVRVSDRLALWGFSQGGHAVLFAAELAPDLAPHLEIIGVAAVAPAMDLLPWADVALDTPQQGYIATIVVAYAEAYGLDLGEILTEEGREYVDEITSSCSDPTGFSVAFAPADDVFAAPPASTEPWRDLFVENSPGSRPIDAPVLLALGTADRILPAEFGAEALEILCAPGTNVVARIYQGADHLGVAYAATPDILDFLDDRLTGIPAPRGC